MQTLQLIGILLVFLVSVALMMLRKLPTILALPIMAIAIAFVAGMPFMGGDGTNIAGTVLQNGAMRLSTAIAGLLFGGWFAKVLTKTGVTRTIIRKAAELAGDKPLPIALTFLAVCSIIFASASGLGMVILVGTIILPIMISAGVAPLTAGLVLLLSNGIGVTFNVSNLGVYIDVLGLPQEIVTRYSWFAGIPLIIVAVAMIVIMITRSRTTQKAWAMPDPNNGEELSAGEKNVRLIALISPVVPVVLVFAFNVPLVAAIVIGIVVTIILSTPKNVVQVVAGGFVEGIQDTAGAAGLMIGIGMVLNAVMAPEVAAVLNPAIENIIPTTAVAFVLLFGVFSFLAIYRGPLNVWGLGSGVVALLAASGMNPVSAMIALRLVSNVQSVCDPTNTHNVWVSDYTKIDVNEFMKKPIPWIFISTFVGLIVASIYLF